MYSRQRKSQNNFFPGLSSEKCLGEGLLPFLGYVHRDSFIIDETTTDLF